MRRRVAAILSRRREPTKDGTPRPLPLQKTPVVAPDRQRQRPRLWAEKYRPVLFDDVHGQEFAVRIARQLAGAAMPHLLLCGPPGTGKNSLVGALVRQLYGASLTAIERSRRVLELNASKERGIDTIRTKVKVFAARALGSSRRDPAASSSSSLSLSSAASTSATRQRFPFKLVVLDEADGMTAVAQAALRMIIEENSQTTRYIVMCNRRSAIIGPLQSRCTPILFRRLAPSAQRTVLHRVAVREALGCSSAVLDALCRQSDGDMRLGLGLLQSAASLGQLETHVRSPALPVSLSSSSSPPPPPLPLLPVSPPPLLPASIAASDRDGKDGTHETEGGVETTRVTMREVERVTTRIPDEYVQNVMRACCRPLWPPPSPIDMQQQQQPSGGGDAQGDDDDDAADADREHDAKVSPPFDAQRLDQSTVPDLLDLAASVLSDAYPAEAMLSQLAQALAETSGLPDRFKWRAMPIVAAASAFLADDADQEIQLSDVFANLYRHALLFARQRTRTQLAPASGA